MVLNRLVAVALALEVGLAAAGLVSDDPSIVSLASGALQGRVDADTGKRLFAGVPFAQPPVDDLRWRAPAPELSWEGVRDATKFQASCYQGKNAFTLVPLEEISEDCLYLNVFTPSADTNASSPVMLFFYGGSWDTGSASSPLYWGEHLVSETPDGVILVTANYRLNVFGFLGGEALRDEDADGTTGNWGLLDQRRAMAWVQENIASFGGDPDRVTIFGESAGAGSVSCHLSSERSYGASPPLFHSAMMESGNPAAAWSAMNMTFAEDRLAIVAASVDCLSEGQSTVDDAAVACMRTKDSQELWAARSNIHANFLRWAPVVDGVELKELPRDVAAAGELANVPVLLGTNADEGTMFIDLDYDATDEEYQEYIISLMGEDLGSRVIAEYPSEDFNEPFDGHKGGHGPYFAAARASGDGFFSCPARRTARSLADNGNDAFLYYFNHTLDVLRLTRSGGFLGLGADATGAFHGSELPFVFDLQVLLHSEEQDLAVAMGQFWSTFTQKGTPAADTVATAWPKFTTAGDHNMKLMTPVDSATVPLTGLKKDKCDWWDTVDIPLDSVFSTMSR